MIVVDASALVAIMCREAGYESLVSAIDNARDNKIDRRISCLSVWEAACAVGRIKKVSRPQALLEIECFLEVAHIAITPASHEITRLAVDAAERYGAGNLQGNPAVLNLGDCFSYATARYFNSKLVCKGDDFPKTDIELA